MITFGRKLKYLRQKNHLTQKELGIALGFPEDSADVRIAQYESDTRKPRDEILSKIAKILCVPIDIAGKFMPSSVILVRNSRHSTKIPA